MTSRPLDARGDILPVLSPADLLTGPEAAAAALRDHLRLYRGDWWENPDRGNEILDLLALSRCTPREASALVTYLTARILALPGIASVSGASASFSGRELRFSCTAHTEEGDAASVSVTF